MNTNIHVLLTSKPTKKIYSLVYYARTGGFKFIDCTSFPSHFAPVVGGSTKIKNP